ncbi:hypothetical protein M1N11_05430 [Peptococcaceae bacterium]|nr:hypothetical protein [Peptococcaceae bacterium]
MDFTANCWKKQEACEILKKLKKMKFKRNSKEEWFKMLLATNQIKFKLLAVIVAIALIAPMVMMPAGAAQAQERVKETNIEVAVSRSLPEEVINAINSNGAEIEIMEDGTPAIVVEVVEEMREEDEEIYYIPLILPSTVEVENVTDGSKRVVEVDGNYLLIPVVEDDEIEIERVCISDFDVKEIKDDGQIVLESEVNPLKTILLLLGSAVIDYVVSETIDEVRNRGSIESKDDPVGIWKGRDAVFPFDPPLFDIRTPPQVLDGFEVIVEAYDVDYDRRERVNVYFISGNTTLWLGALNPGADEKKAWTALRAPSHRLDTIYNALKRNEGKFQIKFEKVTSGWARIDSLRITWTWY